MNKLELSIQSNLNNIRQAVNFVEMLIDRCQIPEELHGKIALPIVEAVNNAILHGNEENPSKMVKLTATEDRRRLVVTVEDEGKGFDLENIPDPTTPDNSMKTTGRGVYLMIHLTDELLFAKNGAKVTMTFFLSK